MSTPEIVGKGFLLFDDLNNKNPFLSKISELAERKNKLKIH